MRAHVRMCIQCSVFKDRTNKQTNKNILKDRYYHLRSIVIMKFRDCMGSLLSGCARGSVTYVHRYPRGQRYEDRHRHARRRRQLKQYTNMYRFVYRRGFGSCFLCSFSACRRVLVVVVRVKMHIPNLARTRIPHIISTSYIYYSNANVDALSF